jgi:hypothetical protein
MQGKKNLTENKEYALSPCYCTLKICSVPMFYKEEPLAEAQGTQRKER